MLSAIAAPAAIAAQLARDGGFVNARQDGDLALVMTRFTQCDNLVSLCLSQLSVTHLCSFTRWFSTEITAVDPPDQKLHFKLETAVA
jgi:hypothetical protein